MVGGDQPAVVYLVVGGFPATRAVQGWLTNWVGVGLVVAGLVAGGVLIAGQFPAQLRQLRDADEPVLHETRLRPAIRLGSAVGSLASAVAVAAALAVSRGPSSSIVTNFHVLDALSNATFMLGLAILLLSFLLFPPGAALLVTTAGTVVLTGSGAALMAGTLVGTSLIAQGLLQMASQGGDSSSGSSGGSGRGSGTSRGTQSDWEAASVRSGRFTEADLPRLRELAKDAAHGGRVTKWP